jgi:hypothetical protein
VQVEQQAEGQVCNMATKNKHRERSHRSYHKNVDFSDFERKAKAKLADKKQKSFFAKLFHRTTNK